MILRKGTIGGVNIEIKTEQLARRRRNGVHLCSITVLAAAVAAGSLSSLSSYVAAAATTSADVAVAAAVAAAASFPQIASLRYTEARNFFVAWVMHLQGAMWTSRPTGYPAKFVRFPDGSPSHRASVHPLYSIPCAIQRNRRLLAPLLRIA